MEKGNALSDHIKIISFVGRKFIPILVYLDVKKNLSFLDTVISSIDLLLEQGLFFKVLFSVCLE